MDKININELSNILEYSHSAFLCGNGFSINFSKDFSNIYDRLFESHQILKRKGKFYISSNTVLKSILKDNYNSVFKYLYNITEKSLLKIFEDGVVFAKSVISNDDLLKDLENSDYLTNLTFGRNELSLVYEIAERGSVNGIKWINIEYWSILILLYFIIKDLSLSYYEFPKNNDFLSMINIGQKNKSSIVGGDIRQYVLTNGFNIYYRMLMSITIFSNGKAIDFTLLEKVAEINTNKLKQWLSEFNTILTLNYDLILENLLGMDIIHLHGQYFVNKKESVYNQSLGLQWDDNVYVSFSDILIGDYFINKISANMINSLNNNPKDRKTLYVSKILEESFDNSIISTVVIFGMGIDNDQHVLRNVMLSLIKRIDMNPRIIYCYFTEDDIQTFKQQYNSVITFNNETNKLVDKIKISFLNSREILNSYFK